MDKQFEPQDYDFYKTLVSEPEQINSEVDMNEDFRDVKGR